MTRYTKLEGRRREHLPASNYFVGSDSEAHDAAKAPQGAAADQHPASTSKESVSAQKSDKKAAKRARGDAHAEAAAGETMTSNTAAGGPSEVKPQLQSSTALVNGITTTSPDDADPSRLQKRAKLLRLKAKKAKDETRKRELEEKARQLDKEASRLNGLKGKEGDSKERGGKKRKTIEEGDGKPKETNPWKVMEAERRAKTDERREVRREKRVEERNATLRCFACRGMGHSARDCPASLNAESELLDSATAGGDAASGLGGASAVELEAKRSQIKGRETVGICFRCGSTEHTLARCRRPTPRAGPELPFATCFICGEKGHLASKCSANQGRGVYPLGGSCKLCSSVEHLAKDCPLRAPSTNAAALNNASMGFASSRPSSYSDPRRAQANQVGADEDDFMHLSRVRAQVDREVKAEKKGSHVKGGAAPPRGGKKVVSF